MRQNVIKKCLVMIEDINNAKKIFSGDIGTLKGKNTRRRPNPVKSNEVEIPKELIERNLNITYHHSKTLTKR